MTNFDIPNNVSSMKYAPKSVPGLADVWVPHGVEDGPITLAPGSGFKKCAYHVSWHEKLGVGWASVPFKAKLAVAPGGRCAFLLR